MTTTNTRANRRRVEAARLRQQRYEDSGHSDRARSAPFVARTRIDTDGNPHPRPFMPAELDKRAEARRDRDMDMLKGLSLAGVTRHELGRIFDRRAPHASRSTAERKHGDRRAGRLQAKLAYATGLLNNAKGMHANGKKMPLEYMHSYARAMLHEAAPLPLAA